MTDDPRIVVAMDFDSAQDCLGLVARLDPSSCRLKVGKELFTSAGPGVVEALMSKGFEVFLDLKFHDIPNTVAGAVRSAAELGVWMINVHACGGRRMLIAAREELEKRRGKRPLLIAVTVLTSMDAEELRGVGVNRNPEEQVTLLARLTHEAGLDGVVCSAREAPRLSTEFGREFCLVTPGIRPVDAATDDQCRVVSPAEAVAAGSHYLVIGRPITRAADPAIACAEIARSIGAA